jgi:hypothetical protein
MPLFSGGNIGNIDPKNIWILLAIATAVLVIACIILPHWLSVAVQAFQGSRYTQSDWQWESSLMFQFLPSDLVKYYLCYHWRSAGYNVIALFQ